MTVLLVIPFTNCVFSVNGGDTLTVAFNNSATASSVYSVTNATVAYDTDEGATHLTANAASPRFSFPINGFSSEYDYAVITYRINNTNSNPAFEGTLTLKNGSATAAEETFCYVRGYKHYSTVIDISAAAGADSATLTFLNSCTPGDNLYLYAVTFCKTSEDAESIAEECAAAADGPVISKYSEKQLKTDSYTCESYMNPYWDTDLIVNEGVYPLLNQDGTIDDISLMYDASRIVSVRNSMLTVEYKEGVDYVLKDGKLRILRTGNIPCVNYTDHYFTTQRSNSYRMRNTYPTRYVRFEEGQNIPRIQLAVTYAHTTDWTGYVPEAQGGYLPRTISKLESGQHLNVVFFGDSLTNGGNSSIDLGMAPFAERYPDMFRQELCSVFPNANVTCTNTSVSGGSWTPEAVENVYGSIVAYAPDLLVLALGTNDYQFQYSAASTIASMEYVVDTVKDNLPNCEIILVAPMMSNPECFDPDLLDQYIVGYRAKAAEYSDVVICDVNSVHKYLLTRKSYTDMSANNLCHANDTFARVYAQVLLKTFYPDALSYASKSATINRLNYVVSQSNYLAAQQQQINAIIAQAASDITNAATFTEADRIFREARARLKSLPTKSEAAALDVDYTNILFDSNSKKDLFTQANNVTIGYSSTENAVTHTATTAGGDPHAGIVFPSTKPISADTYKYAVLTYMVPTSVSSTATTTQMFFCAGNVLAPTDSVIRTFSPVKDGDFHSEVIDLSGASWWNGIIRQIRIDHFQNCQKNDTMYLWSLRLCKTQAEAENAASVNADRANGVYVGASGIAMFDSAASLDLITSPTISVLRGDCNRDGDITAKDSRMLKQYIADVLATDIDPIYLDVNCDGDVTAKDSRDLKKFIVGTEDSSYAVLKCSEPNKSFDPEGSFAVVSSGLNDYATFCLDEPVQDGAVAVLIYSATGNNVLTRVWTGDDASSGGTVALITTDGTFDSLIVNIPAGVEASSVSIDIEGITLNVDSFAIFEMRSNADEFIYERLWERHSPKVYNENVKIVFDENMIANITEAHNANYSRNSSNVLSLSVGNPRTDPYVYLDLTSLGISANEYKYMVYNYMLPTSNGSRGKQAQIFFCSDNATVPAEASSVKFDTVKSGTYIYKTFDLTSASYWGGNVLGLRLDFFCDADTGDACYVKSITFCKTQADLQAALN